MLSAKKPENLKAKRFEVKLEQVTSKRSSELREKKQEGVKMAMSRVCLEGR